MSENERTLVERFVEIGDEGAFCTLYDRYTPALFRIVFRLSSLSRAEAEDIVQEVWLRASRSLRHFQWRSTLKTWLTGIAVNCCRERLKRCARPPDSAEEPREAPDFFSAQLAETARIDLERAFQLLPNGCREVLFLFDVEGFSHAEIAVMLGVDEGTSRSQLFKARAKLRRHLRSRPSPKELNNG